ncbi:hypothetical protein [Caulobacter sp.]|uniref:hypothetical protein n=1 Tax=Caulobacter sp. TaxID=78 RepID=UPI002B47FF1B|nr:hypothetical protein [Caulobacter sp.]HJV40088.1 hypothetical protein [Caulobacter sp.]
MTHPLKFLPLFFALIATPAFAVQADSHAQHHPAVGSDAKAAAPAASTAEAKPAMKGCPMMDGRAPAGPGGMAGDGKMMEGRMMMDGKDMHCMTSPAPKATEPPRDHDHPAPPKK